MDFLDLGIGALAGISGQREEIYCTQAATHPLP